MQSCRQGVWKGYHLSIEGIRNGIMGIKSSDSPKNSTMNLHEVALSVIGKRCLKLISFLLIL